MELTIGSNTYGLKFGFAFIDYVNNATGIGLSKEGYTLALNGLTGMKMLLAGISIKNPSTLRIIIKGATTTLKSKPSNEDIDLFIEELTENDENYNSIFDSIIEEMGEHSLVLKEMGISNEQWKKAKEKDKIANQKKEQ